MWTVHETHWKSKKNASACSQKKIKKRWNAYTGFVSVVSKWILSINFKYIAKNETRVVLSILVLDDTNTSTRKISK